MPVITVIKTRRDTAANWISTNPILAAGEAGLETDTGLVKYGNATDAWVDLDYASISVIKEKVQNSTGSTIAKGAAVYISGANGDNALISLADADTELTSSKTLGLASAAIANGAIGTITTNGFIEGLNTSAATAGDSVWLSGTAGQFVFGAPPAKPAHGVYLGVVTRAHATQGAILVKVQNGYELNELHDVAITSVANKQVIQYDSATGLWKNATISAGVTVSDTAPSSPSQGDQWYNSAEGRTYVYYDSFWVEASPSIAGPEGPAGVQTAATAPSDTTVIWNDTSSVGAQVLPPNGSKGQVLTKLTDSSFDTTWTTPVGTGNLLLNADFNINQRNVTSVTTTSTFAFDRWFLRTGGNGTATYTAQTFTTGGRPNGGNESANYARIVTAGFTTTDTLVGLRQMIEDVRTLAGKTVTISFWARSATGTPKIGAQIYQYFGSGGSAVVNNSFGEVTINTNWNRYSVTAMLPEITGKILGPNHALGMSLYTCVGTAINGPIPQIGLQDATVDFWGIQVEAGSVATPFRTNTGSFQAELAACQRYYQRIYSTGSYAFLHMAAGTSSTKVRGIFPNAVTMRTSPTSIESSGIYLDNGSTVTAPSGVVLFSTVPGATAVEYQFASGITPGYNYSITGQTTSSYLALSAEL